MSDDMIVDDNGWIYDPVLGMFRPVPESYKDLGLKELSPPDRDILVSIRRSKSAATLEALEKAEQEIMVEIRERLSHNGS